MNNAQSVGLVYLERDHAHFREIKDLAKTLKEKFGVRRVGMMSYVSEEMKDTPTWLVKKLDSGYFCKSDLNWHGWPVKEFEAFVAGQSVTGGGMDECPLKKPCVVETVPDPLLELGQAGVGHA